MRGALTKLPGVLGVEIKPGDEDFSVTYEAAKVKPEALTQALIAAGEKLVKLKT